MHAGIALALVAGAVAGAATATAAVFLLTPPTGPSAPAASIAPPDPGAELAVLRDQNRALSARMDDLEDRLVVAESMRRVPDDVVARSEQELEELREAVAAMRPEDPTAVSPVFIDDVKAAMQAIEDERERERDERREQAMNERLEERLTELTTTLGLGTDQVASLRTATTTFYQRTGEYLRQARESGDFDDARNVLRQYRDEAETAILATLSPLQQQQYEEADISLLGFGRDFDRGRDFGRRDD